MLEREGGAAARGGLLSGGTLKALQDSLGRLNDIATAEDAALAALHLDSPNTL